MDKKDELMRTIPDAYNFDQFSNPVRFSAPVAAHSFDIRLVIAARWRCIRIF